MEARNSMNGLNKSLDLIETGNTELEIVCMELRRLKTYETRKANKDIIREKAVLHDYWRWKGRTLRIGK